MRNTEKAVTIIAVLSLLLGLSLGQNHRQYLELQQMKAASVAPMPEFSSQHDYPPACNRTNVHLREKMEELRLHLEKRKAELEEQRRRLEVGERFEVKDPENGAKTIIRIVREE